MAKHKYTKDEIAEWREKHSKIFYFNPDDSNISVPKAYTFGFTLNWANPISWIVGAAMIAVVAWALSTFGN